jgi:type I restriction enzyme S subunit
MKTNQLQKNIPDGWQLKKLADICNKEKSDVSANTLDFNNGGYPIYGASGFIKNIDFYRQKKNYISIIKDGAGVGRLTLHRAQTSVLGTLDILHENENSHLMFLYFLLQIIDFKKYMVGSTIPHIYFKDYKKEKIMVPSLPEQNRIVAVLETWDKSIEKLNKKIEIKKQIKKGLMQDLLTGKKRLSGFNEEWKFRLLKNSALIQKGEQLNIEHMKGGEFPVVNGGIMESGFTNTKNVDKNTITISEGGNSCGFVNYITKDFWLGGHCYAVYEYKDINKMFLYFLLKLNQTRLMSLRVGSGLPNIQLKSLNNFKLNIPIDIKEQNAIAEILITADKEITELKKKLSIIKNQKKYLLNNLITGIIRTPEKIKN